ncbi:MAG: metallophosphoesterase [Verrucomicrobiota bacterium]
MKVLHVADLHYALKQFDWLVGQKDEYDLIIIAGDLLDMGGFLEKDLQTVVVDKYFQKLIGSCQLAVISGNHDFDSEQEGEHYANWLQGCRQHDMYVDGDTFTTDGCQVVLLPWVNGPETEAWAKHQVEQAQKETVSRRIWAFHEPADKSPTSWNGKRHFGSTLLIDWVKKYQPDIVLGGHVHNAPFYGDGSWKDQIGKTWLFNPGKQIGPVPTMISFDLESEEATWDSLEGRERQSLVASG